MAYSERADIELKYGRDELAVWADPNGDGVTADVAAAITNAISLADNRIDDALRGGPYEVPFSPIPSTIVELSAMLAGVLLYEGRGVKDFDPETGQPQHRLHWQRTEVRQRLAGIKSGAIRLDVATGDRTSVSHPSVVNIADDFVR